VRAGSFRFRTGGTRNRSSGGAPAGAITRFSKGTATKSSQTTTCASARSLPTVRCRRGIPSWSSVDETEVGDGTTVTLINATRPAEWKQTNNPYDCAEWLGLNPWAADGTSWDIFDAVLTPGELILLISWKDAAAAQAYEDASAPNDEARVRKVRIVRDYGKYDRREAPQYYADAKGGETLHA
jgi:hypothetical protein